MAGHRDAAFDTFRRYQDLYVIIRPIVDAPFIRWLETQKGVETTAASPAWRVYRLPRIGGPVPLPLPLGSPGPQF